jgi:short subunit dehydrogenase-like uncharacterized protein
VSSTQHYDLVLYGATGFTGRQTARYVARRAPKGLRWAIAGRNAARLDALARELEPTGVLVADSSAPSLVDAMVATTRVLLTTAGPYAKYGTPVLAACARAGVDYVDITGETPWVRRMIDEHHLAATDSGARIVPFCGYDSVPSDIGTLLAVDALRARGEATRLVSASFAGRGGLNGGTLDSALTMAESGQTRLLADPLLLNPAHRRSADEAARSRDLRSVRYDADRDVWLAPFVMAAVNTRVVRRSNALLADRDRAYGAAFTYREAMELRTRWQAIAATLAIGAFEQATRRAVTRSLLRRFGPAPGQGPSERSMDSGFFRTRLVAEGEGGQRLMVTMQGDGDPGNRITVTILCEAALLLATDRAALPDSGGGILTPATALGLPLARRLEAAGFTIALRDLD